METTTEAFAPASDGSRVQDKVVDELPASYRPPTCSSSTSKAADDHMPPVEQKRSSSAGFRKMREALMAKIFESHDNVPVEVDAASGLFIGTYGAANNFEALKRAGITHILCVSPSLLAKFPEEFKYLRLAVADQNSACISANFDEALSFIDSALESGGKILVHCFMGRSRSATIILAYFISRQKLTLSEALKKLRIVRPQAQPNSGFYQELVAFEAAQKQHNTAS